MITTLFEVARLTLSLQLRSRLYQLLLLFAVAAPWAVTLIPGDEVRGSSLFQMICATAVFHVLLPFVSLYLTVHAVHSDIEDRTVTYLFTRPISRLEVLGGKLLATVLCGWVFALLLICSLFVAIAYTGIEWRAGMMPRGQTLWVMLSSAALMVVGYTGSGTLVAAWFRRPLLVAMVVMIIEIFASRLPPEVGIHNFTVHSPIRRHMVEQMEHRARIFRRFMTDDMGARRRRRNGGSTEQAAAQTPALLVLLKIWSMTLLLGGFIYTRREYDSRAQE